MSAYSRLHTAIDDSLLIVPDGPVSVMRPPTGYDLSPVMRAGLTVSHSFFPDVDAWKTSGYAVDREIRPADTVIIVVPRAKALARAMFARAAQFAKLIVVDGQKTDGIDSLFNACRKRLGNLPSVTKAHGRLFWCAPDADFSDWAEPEIARRPHGFYTKAGVFSDGAIDKGSALLVEKLPAKLGARVADLGAGWGYLSTAILKRDGVKSLDLIEAEALSLDCARLNVIDPRARFHWADATRFAAERPYDAVVMNPPFHTGRAADSSLGQEFIAAAARLLAPHGTLWMVANRQLPYEQTLRDKFRNVDALAVNGPFKIFHATRPIR